MNIRQISDYCTWALRGIRRRLWPIFRPYRKTFIVISVLSISVQAARLAVMSQLGILVEGFNSQSSGWLYGRAWMVADVSAIAACLVTLLSMYSYSRLFFPIERIMVAVSLRKLESMSISQIISQDIELLRAKIKKGHQAIRECIERGVTELLPIVWSLIIIVPKLFMMHWLLGVIGIMGFGSYLVESIRLNAQVLPGANSLTATGEKVDRNFEDVIRLFKLVKTSNEEQRTLIRVDRQLKAYCDQGSDLWIGFFGKSLWGKEVIALLCLVGLLVTSIWLYGRHSISVSDVVTSIMWSLSMFYSMASIGNLQRTFMQNRPLIKDYYEFLDTPVRKVERTKEQVKVDLFGDIVLTNISNRVLDKVSVTIKCGTTVAIVGRSGAGKTTLVETLSGFYENYVGTITINGHNIRSISQKELFHKIRFMSQSPEFFHASLRDNMKFGLNGTADKLSDEALINAAKQFYVDPVRFAERLDSIMGDGGFRPSGGEIQRLALTRAMLPQPDIIILDEPTNALDPINEILVRRAISEAAKDRTCLIIAHKLVTARAADMVIVMDDGKIVGIGTHKELMVPGVCLEYEWLVRQERNAMLLEEKT